MHTNAEFITTLAPKSGQGFIETPFVSEIIDRALNYLNADFPIHFRGMSGTGKTTLALRVAEMLGRPVMMLHGDEELRTSDLLGGENGYRKRSLRDNYIHSVLKIEEDVDKQWVDRHLMVAIENGFTLIYDEFTRSRPEANNVLLSILQEGFLNVPPGKEGKLQYLRVHPQFRAIFTSNPEEYAGVHRSQDALRDRMITMDLQSLDKETEIEITIAKSGLSKNEVTKIVEIVKDLRESGQYEFSPTVRACIMIAKSAAAYGKNKITINSEDKIFRRICLDILGSETSRSGSLSSSNMVQNIVNEAINKYCGKGCDSKIKYFKGDNK